MSLLQLSRMVKRLRRIEPPAGSGFQFVRTADCFSGWEMVLLEFGVDKWLLEGTQACMYHNHSRFEDSTSFKVILSHN
jgi:hypothetical protein